MEPTVTIKRAAWPHWFVEVWWPEPDDLGHGRGTWTLTKRGARRWARRTIRGASRG